MSANNEFGISSAHISIFTNLNLLKEISCKRKVIFDSIAIPSSHSIDIYKLINEYLRQEIRWKFEYMKEGYDIACISSLMINCSEDEIVSVISDHEIRDNVIVSVGIYNFFRRRILSNYIVLSKGSKKKSAYHVDDNDYRYSKLIYSEIIKKTKNSQSLVNVFFILLFFDLFSIFSYSVKKQNYSDELRSIAQFILHVLPLLIGTYRYGSYSSLLRDNAFKVFDKEKYENILSLINKGLPSNSFIVNMEDHLDKVSKIFPATFKVKGRRKGVYSSFKKSEQYNMPVEKLWDLYAIRIIIDSDNEGYCYELLALLEKKWKRWESRKGYFDYISKPKDNGYQSIHTVLTNKQNELIEVQIRTSLMHFIAEFGLASHAIYKNIENKGKKLDAEYDPVVVKGKMIIEKYLNENGLSLNDYIDHLKNALKILPIEHYYEGIAKKKYDPKQIVKSIISLREEI